MIVTVKLRIQLSFDCSNISVADPIQYVDPAEVHLFVQVRYRNAILSSGSTPWHPQSHPHRDEPMALSTHIPMALHKHTPHLDTPIMFSPENIAAVFAYEGDNLSQCPSAIQIDRPLKLYFGDQSPLPANHKLHADVMALHIRTFSLPNSHSDTIDTHTHTHKTTHARRPRPRRPDLRSCQHWQPLVAIPIGVW